MQAMYWLKVVLFRGGLPAVKRQFTNYKRLQEASLAVINKQDQEAGKIKNTLHSGALLMNVVVI